MKQSESKTLQPQTKISNQLFQPAGAWTVILAFCFLTVLMIALGAFGSRILNILFPLGAFIVGWLLYFRYPILYNGFVWWLFFITPFIRRISDWRIGEFTDPKSSYIMLAPFVACIICAHTIHLKLFKTHDKYSSIFILAISAVLYSYFIGMVYRGFLPSTISLLEWIAPLLFGYHLAVNWQRYPMYAENIKRVFLWGGLVMGIYGVYQFMIAPEWDRLWMIGSGMTSSGGSPVPFGMRIWSTMNSQGPFADYIVTCLLILLSCQGALVIPAAGFTAFSLLLTLVRVAWIGWILAMLSLLTSLTPKQKFRLLAAVVIMVIMLIPLINMEPFSSVIFKRLETMTDLQNDGSSQARQGTYAAILENITTNFLGDGLGALEGDSALIVIVNLGWIGGIPYVGSLIFGTLLVLMEPSKNDDLMIPVVRGILIKSFIFLLSSITIKGAHGMLMWGFLGLGLSGIHYYRDYHLHQFLMLKSRDKLPTS